MSKDYRILQGDVRDVLATLGDASVHMVVTSPPYHALRDYGLPPSDWPAVKYAPIVGLAPISVPAVTCCLGLEPTIEAYVGHMVAVFRELRRVLRDDGVVFFNIGDSYANSGQTGGDRRGTLDNGGKPSYTPVRGLKPKDLCMVPARLALALQAAGWWVRQDIIWRKTAPMPESVTDRCTRSHEYIFLIAKSEHYYFDTMAIAEPLARPNEGQRATPARFGGADKYPEASKQSRLHSGNEYTGTPTGTRNVRSVWTIGPEPLKDEHYAAFPTTIPDRCIRAGTSERGVCPECGAPWRRVVERTGGNWEQRKAMGAPERYGMQPPSNPLPHPLGKPTTHTLGWEASCKCGRTDVQPAVVLDPFSGAGTTCLVALRLGRRAIGIELNPEYIAMSHKRILGDPRAMNLNMELVEMEESA